MRPPLAALADLDAVLFDLPDLGVRCYTYIWTLSHVMEACAEARVRLMVLDRPNPLGGELEFAEGPMLDAVHCSSFVGRWPLPVRHSLTVGELARLWNVEQGLNTALEVLPCVGWRRELSWPETGLEFVPTSPAITCFGAAQLYPALCFFEATNLSVGRGSSVSFQAVGAPWLRADELARCFNIQGGTGVLARAIRFTPALPPYAGIPCAGVQLLVTEPRQFRPVASGLILLAGVIQLHRECFAWARYPTAANPMGEGHFERLVGRTDIRPILDATPAAVGAQLAAWTSAVDWRPRAQRALIYA